MHLAALAADFGVSVTSPMAGPATKNSGFWWLDLYPRVALLSEPAERPFWEPIEGVPVALDGYSYAFPNGIWGFSECAYLIYTAELHTSSIYRPRILDRVDLVVLLIFLSSHRTHVKYVMYPLLHTT